MQFVIYTDWYLPHVQRELNEKNFDMNFDNVRPMGADIGYHSPKPMYEDQKPMGQCDILGCECYYDGTSLGAQEFIPEFLAGGSEAVWKRLEDEYNRRFLPPPTPEAEE